MMQKGQSWLLVSVVLLVILTISHCQKNDRRAVTEHQFLHDRGRSIQSLKRLIWLSSAIERLHTAQTRSVSTSNNHKDDGGDDGDDGGDDGGDDAVRYQPVRDSTVHWGALQMLLSDMYRPHVTAKK